MRRWIRTALHDCPSQPWANGRGLTQEILAWPQPDDWSVRVSVAQIAQSGPYSVLPDTKRWHSILKGQVTLHFERTSVALDAQSAPYPFDGSISCECHLVEGPALAFNTMTRGPFKTTVVRIMTPAQGSLASMLGLADKDSCVLAGVYAMAPTQVANDKHKESIGPDHWIWSDQMTSDQLRETIVTTDTALLVVVQATEVSETT